VEWVVEEAPVTIFAFLEDDDEAGGGDDMVGSGSGGSIGGGDDDSGDGYGIVVAVVVDRVDGEGEG
jgi:hypothetical protein